MLRAIGYWATSPEDRRPSPGALVDGDLNQSEASWVAAYLDRGMVAGSAMGSATCRICGKPVGHRDFTDMEFIWPEGLSHYVLEHQVRLPSEFLVHIDNRLAELEQLDVDDAWWISSVADRDNEE